MKIYSLSNIVFYLLISIQSIYSQNLNDFLTDTSKYNKDLTAVLDYYKSIGSEEKYRAAVFLIENMTIHKSHNYVLMDKFNKIVPFSELNYDDFDDAVKGYYKIKDSLNTRFKKTIRKDIDDITFKLLTSNIDFAYDAWKNNPWSKSYSFDIFCEYILPYRSLIEPLEEWREEYAFLVERSKYNLNDPSDPMEVCINMMNELKGFSFSSNKGVIPSSILSPQQLLFRRIGTCPDLANLALLSARSLGIAVTFDFTPHYGASSNRHYWNSVIDKNGKHVPFNGSSPNSEHSKPNNYNLNNKRLAKVFRKTYSIQSASLASNLKEKMIPNGFLKSKNIIDVTSEYVPVGSIKYNTSGESSNIAYLNVFNNFNWQIVDWAEKKKNKFEFKNIGKNVVYLPSFYNQGKTTYAQFPILLMNNDEFKTLKPNYSKTFDCTLSRNNEHHNIYKENNPLTLQVGEFYNLYCWDKRWKKIETANATIDGVYFENIPSNALLILTPSQPSKYERVFVLNEIDKKITWY